MHPAVKVSRLLIVLLVFALYTLWGGMQEKPGSPFSFAAPAFAAVNNNNYDDEGEEPFGEDHIATLDPLEPMNRAFFQFNDRLYFWFLKPVGTFYGKVIPPGIRTDIKNAYENILFPIRFVNNTLQGKFKGAGVELTRFVINTTLGFGGMFDIANTHFNLHPYDEDFGQTLGFYGMRPMIFINWPILGPSTGRDTIGLVGDTFLNPIYYLAPNMAVRAGVQGGIKLNNTSMRIGEYEDFKASALDPYVSMRDFFLNYRAQAIKR